MGGQVVDLGSRREDGGRHEPQCKCCNLPPKYKERLATLLGSGMSPPKTAAKLNEELEKDGYSDRVTGKGIWRHITNGHASSGLQAVYRLQVAERDLPPGMGIAINPFAETPDILRSDSPIAQLSEHFGFMLSQVNHKYEDLSARSEDDDELLDKWLKVHKEARATAEAILKVVNPQTLVALFLAEVHHKYTEAMTAETVNFIQGLARALETRIHDDQVLNMVREIVTEHGKSFGLRFEETAKFYEGQLARMAGERGR